MKLSNYFLLLACCLLVFQSQAQTSLGIKTGYTRAWENYGDIELPDDAVIHIDGVNVGVILNSQLNKHFQLSTELGYARRGAACEPGWSSGGQTFDADSRWLLDYIEMPLSIVYLQPLIPNSLDLTGKFGCTVAYLVKGVSVRAANEPIDLRPFVNRFDTGFQTGLGLRKHFGKHQIFFDTDFYLAVMNVNRIFTSQNRSVDLNLGYLFTL